MNFRLLPTVFAVFYLQLFFSQKSLAVGTCKEVYKSRPKGYLVAPERANSQTEIAFWPRPENAVLGNKSNQVAHLLAQDSARQQHKGSSKVYRPELIERELYTPSSAPQIDRLYLAHKLLLGDLIKSDLYADAVMNVLAEDRIVTPEEIKRFVDNFNGWKSLNANASESFLSRAAREFALKLESYVGESVDYAKLDEARVKYGLSVEDLIQLKSNLATLRENNDGNLKISIMLPMLADGTSTVKLLNEALVRWKSANNMNLVPTPSDTLSVATPQKGWSWHMRSIRNFGKKIFSVSQLRFARVSAIKNEELLLKSEATFNISRSDFSLDPNFLKKIFVDIEKGKQFKMPEVVALIKSAPGYFFVAPRKKTKGGYSAVETHIRIRDFIEALGRMKLEDKNSASQFIYLQETLDNLKDLVFNTAGVFSSEGLTLDGNLAGDILIADVPAQNTIWEKHLADKINQAKKQLTEFYVEARKRDGENHFSPYELEVIYSTRTNPVFTELFYRAKRGQTAVQPVELLDLISVNKLSTYDVLYLLRSFDPRNYTTFSSLKKLYLAAKLPLFSGSDVNADFNFRDLKAVFIARLAMSFDTTTQRLNLDDFNYIFDTIYSFGTEKTLLGKAALTKFFKSVIGPSPTLDDTRILEMNALEAYIGTLKNLHYDHLQFLHHNFGITIDPKKAATATLSLDNENGSGAFEILNWIKGAHLSRNRGR